MKFKTFIFFILISNFVYSQTINYHIYKFKVFTKISKSDVSFLKGKKIPDINYLNCDYSYKFDTIKSFPISYLNLAFVKFEYFNEKNIINESYTDFDGYTIITFSNDEPSINDIYITFNFDFINYKELIPIKKYTIKLQDLLKNKHIVINKNICVFVEKEELLNKKQYKRHLKKLNKI